MSAGHLNGSGKGPDGGNITSLDEARRRAAARAKEEKRAARDAMRGGAMRPRDWLIGGLFVLMAFGLAWHWLAPLIGAKGLV